MPVVLVHGGAWAIPARWRADTVAGCEAAADVAWAVLAAGGSAVDAVVAAVRSMEDHPTLSAGVGAAPDAHGELRLDAALVRGTDLACGAAAWLPPTRHPIDLARAILDHSPHVLLVGPDALAFGAPYGVSPCAPEELALPPDVAGIVWGCDTVGAVALDDAGRLASALSTGGTPGRHPARVGDVPLIGCGTYADDAVGAAAATGSGEGIIRVVLARSCLADLEAGQHPQAVAEARVQAMTARTGLTGGVILLDRHGQTGLFHTTPAMCWARRGGAGSASGWAA